MKHGGYVYILASRRAGTLYTGITADLERRVSEHQQGTIDGFTEDYDVTRLVHYEVFDRIGAAIAREKAMKKWRREWKMNLIERQNPEWRDLSVQLGFEPQR